MTQIVTHVRTQRRATTDLPWLFAPPLGTASGNLEHLALTKTDFLQRDKKAKCRNAMEAGARDSYWHTAALKFCDKSFKPALLTPKDELHTIFVKAKLTPAWGLEDGEEKEYFERKKARILREMQKLEETANAPSPAVTAK